MLTDKEGHFVSWFIIISMVEARKGFLNIRLDLSLNGKGYIIV